MDTTDLRSAVAHVRAAEEIFRRGHRELSGEQLDLEWSRFFCSSSLASGYPPDLSRTASWTPGWPGGPQVTSPDDTQPLQMTRSQDYSSQSAPEPLSRSPNAVLGHAMLSTMSASSRLPSAAAKHHSTGPATRARRKHRQTQIPDVIGEYDLPQYLTANGLPASCYPDHSRLSVTTASTLDRSYSHDGSSPPSTPATALTDTSTLSSQMMSQNGSIDSNYNDLSQSIGMFRFSSNASNFSFSGGDSTASVDFSADLRDNCLAAFAPSHQSDQKYLSTHGLDLSPTSTFNCSSEALSAFSSRFSTSTDATVMNKSQSSTGSESDSSANHFRSYRSRRQEHIRQAQKCPIAPKAGPSGESTTMVRVTSSDGSVQMKASIPRKPPYQRPQQPRQYCSLCSDHPEGFRGEHELQRHTSRAHPCGSRKFWICEDLKGDGSFLADCKACVGKKRYGADYNAAAHLRRTHFNPRKRGRKPKHDGEKRGGMGGGKEPPINFLKTRWMREVEEDLHESHSPVDYSNDAAVDAQDEQMGDPSALSALEDQLKTSLDSVSHDEYDSLWQSEVFQFNATPESLEVGYNFPTDGASDSCVSYDVQPPQHAYASPELEAFQFEESFHWQQ